MLPQRDLGFSVSEGEAEEITIGHFENWANSKGLRARQRASDEESLNGKAAPGLKATVEVQEVPSLRYMRRSRLAVAL